MARAVSLAKARRRVRDYLLRQEALAWRSAVEVSARKVVRGRVVARYRRRPLRVRWLHPSDPHWADTDGESVWLATHGFDDETLFFTLLHEELHGVVRRVGTNGVETELSEWREHRMMQQIDARLV